MVLRPLSFLLMVGLLAFACNRNRELQLFQLLSEEESGISFANTITASDTLNVINFEYIYNGGGVSVGDINNDSLPDLYFTGNMVSSRLYLNKGNMQFEDITAKAGAGTDSWATGVAMTDVNGDGWLDIYVSIAGKSKNTVNQLFINQQNGTFREMAAQYGLADNAYSTQAAFLDYDSDGDLDCYLLTNALETFNRNANRPRMTDGSGKSNDRLYRNDGNGTFTNQIARYLKHQSHNGMGTDIADFNNDGLSDIAVVDMLPPDNSRHKSMFSNINYDRFKLSLEMGYEPQYIRNSLQLNNGNGTFSEIGQMAGVDATDWSWTPLFAGFDNDGLKDLLITNGYGKDVTDMDFIVYSREGSMFGTDDVKRKNAMART